MILKYIVVGWILNLILVFTAWALDKDRGDRAADTKMATGWISILCFIPYSLIVMLCIYWIGMLVKWMEE